MARRVVDFTSSLYLGMRHASAELPPWSALTSGRPAALDRPAGSAAAAYLAGLAGAESGRFVRSALHGLSDCLEILLGPDAAIVVDAGVYPVGRWAVQRAAGSGAPLSWVGHHDVGGVEASLRRLRRRGLRSVVVADGLCTGCGRLYPVGAVTELSTRLGATLLLDDTQALGVLGHRTDAGPPYGRGGGGSVAYAGVPHDATVTVSSLAKAFGAPVTCVTGPADVIERLAHTGSALHSSPPSTVDIAAAERAVECNANLGERLRTVLANRVHALRHGAIRHGLALVGGLFPVQSTPSIDADTGAALVGRLAGGGVRAVLRRSCGGRAAVTLVVTAAHARADVERAAALLGRGWRQQREAVRDAG